MAIVPTYYYIVIQTKYLFLWYGYLHFWTLELYYLRSVHRLNISHGSFWRFIFFGIVYVLISQGLCLRRSIPKYERTDKIAVHKKSDGTFRVQKNIYSHTEEDMNVESPVGFLNMTTKVSQIIFYEVPSKLIISLQH